MAMLIPSIDRAASAKSSSRLDPITVMIQFSLRLGYLYGRAAGSFTAALVSPIYADLTIV